MKDVEILEVEKLDGKEKDNIVNLVLHTIKQNKQVLVFNNSKSSSELTAEKIANSITNLTKQSELNILAEKILTSISTPTKQCLRLAKCVRKGIAFHHSGLVAKQRNLIEKSFKEGLIKVISSTPTLAAGLNLPAYKVIIKDYKRYSSRGFNDIPILEYHQMAGRAGRPGVEEIGKAVVFVKDQSELDRVVPKYVFGKPEEIISKLAVEPTLKMYSLSLISMGIVNTKPEIERFFKSTLYGNQYQDDASLFYNVYRILDILKSYSFVTQEDNYYMATPMGKRVSELYLNPDTAHFFLEKLDFLSNYFSKGVPRKNDIFLLVHFISSTIEMKPLFRIYKKEEEHYMNKVEDIEQELFVKYDPFEVDLKEFLNSVKTTDILIDWIYEAPEDYISEKYSITPGELNYKIDIVDWLLYCLEELSLLKKNFYFKNFLNKLRIRFQFGIKSELIPLVALKGIGRVRARKLHDNNLKFFSDLRSVEFLSLSRLLGDSLAIKVKEQVQGKEEIKQNLADKPKEIKVRQVEEVISDDEINKLVETYQEFEKEKEEFQKNLNDFF